MRISELYTTQKVFRRHRNKDGSLAYEEKTFQIPYNPNVPILYRRAFAKAIDFGMIIGIMVLINKIAFPINTDAAIIFPILILSELLCMSLLETFTGITPGKLILGLQAVDDTGNRLSFKITMCRKLYATFVLIMGVFLKSSYTMEYEHWLAKKKIFVIKRKDKATIIAMMNA